MAGDPGTRFADDVRRGLSESAKSLPCVYFYDERGSRLFERICELPEYYCTRAENEILRSHAPAIAQEAPDPVQMVELGCGSAIKTRHLIQAMLATHGRVIYRPVDVSKTALSKTADELSQTYPKLYVRPVHSRYEDCLEEVFPKDGGVLLLWLGSGIGNLEREDAATFLSDLRRRLSPGDQMLIGFDLIKPPGVLEAAYSDSAGVTAEFNLNLLVRINRELGGRFDLDRFQHMAVYNTGEDRIEMYLESRCSQEVPIEALNMTVRFKTGERIHTEDSYKYDQGHIAGLVETVGMHSIEQWLDSRKRFCLNLFSIQ